LALFRNFACGWRREGMSFLQASFDFLFSIAWNEIGFAFSFSLSGGWGIERLGPYIADNRHHFELSMSVSGKGSCPQPRAFKTGLPAG